MSTISILLKQEDERVICSFSCVNKIMPNMNIVGEGYMGVTQSVFTLENTNLLREYIKEKKSIIGFESSIPDYRQYGFLFNDKCEVYHGNLCKNDYGHYSDKNLLVIGNRVKSNKLLLNLFNDLKNSEGLITYRVAESLKKNKIIGFDNICEIYGVSSSSISFMKYDNSGNNTYRECYVGINMDPIDYLYDRLINPHQNDEGLLE